MPVYLGPVPIVCCSAINGSHTQLCASLEGETRIFCYVCGASTSLDWAYAWSALGARHLYCEPTETQRLLGQALIEFPTVADVNARHGIPRDQTETAMTHAELVRVAARWLRRQKCGVVLTEHVGVLGFEIPDAIGFRFHYAEISSIQVECKTSVSDFRRDARKARSRSRSRPSGARTLVPDADRSPNRLRPLSSCPTGLGTARTRRHEGPARRRSYARNDARSPRL